MDNQLPELKVNMLGRFSITYGDQPITFKRNSATKAVKLLQILLHSSLTENQGNGGISRAQLLDDLLEERNWQMWEITCVSPCSVCARC